MFLLHKFLSQVPLVFPLSIDSASITFFFFLVILHELLHETRYLQHLFENIISCWLQLAAFSFVKHPHQLPINQDLCELVEQLLGLRIDDLLANLFLNIRGHLFKQLQHSSGHTWTIFIILVNRSIFAKIRTN